MITRPSGSCQGAATTPRSPVERKRPLLVLRPGGVLSAAAASASRMRALDQVAVGARLLGQLAVGDAEALLAFEVGEAAVGRQRRGDRAEPVLLAAQAQRPVAARADPDQVLAAVAGQGAGRLGGEPDPFLGFGGGDVADQPLDPDQSVGKAGAVPSAPSRRRPSS